MRREAAARGIDPGEPPEAPYPGSCCERGCERCVMVVYHEALRIWRREALGETTTDE